MSKLDELLKNDSEDNYWAIKASIENVQWMYNWINDLRYRFGTGGLTKSASQIVRNEIVTLNFCSEITHYFSWAKVDNEMVFEVVELMIGDDCE